MTDYLTGKKAGKGSYFPLRIASKRAGKPADEANEHPVLLDPVVGTDTRLLCFSEDSGSPVPRYGEHEDKWLNQRAADSIHYYHLDEGTWNAERKDLMDATQALCADLEKLVAQGQRNTAAYDDAVNTLLELIDPFSKFSSACLQVARDRGLLEEIFPGLQ